MAGFVLQSKMSMLQMFGQVMNLATSKFIDNVSARKRRSEATSDDLLQLVQDVFRAIEKFNK